MQRKWFDKTSLCLTPKVAHWSLLVLCLATIFLSFVSLIILVTIAPIMKIRWDLFLGAVEGLVFMEAVLACHLVRRNRCASNGQSYLKLFPNSNTIAGTSRSATLSSPQQGPPFWEGQRRRTSLFGASSCPQRYLLWFTFSIWLMASILYSVGYRATLHRRNTGQGSSWSLEESDTRAADLTQRHFTKLLALEILTWIIMLALTSRLVILRMVRQKQSSQQW